MGVSYNMDEVLQMAERIESNAMEFYSKAAGLRAGKADAEFFRQLVKMEEGHRKTFAAMRKQLPAEMQEPPEDYPFLKASIYLNRLADMKGGEGALSQGQPLTASDTLDGILRRGIAMEQQAILFYLGLRDAVPENRGKKQVDTIIAMEKEHMAELAARLEQAKG